MKNNCCGIFESMRCYKGKIVYFDEHLKRLRRSCKLLSIRFPYRLGNLKNEINKIVKASRLKDAYVKLALSGPGEKSFLVKRYQPFTLKQYSQGFNAGIARSRQNNPRLARIKTTDRFVYESAFEQAKKNNFDEALIINRAGYVCEATRSNIFLVTGNQLVTPQLECGCLEGITRKAIFDIALEYGIRVSQSSFTVKEALSADEAFLTNSLMGVMPLVSVSRKPIGRGKPGRLTKFFIAKYRLLLKDGS